MLRALGDFGAVVTQPDTAYAPGRTARAVFVSANPNNDLHTGRSYLEVQRRDENTWVRIADDGDWETRFRWHRRGRTDSVATVEWVIPADVVPGRYRLLHHGAARGRDGRCTPFTGVTHAFTVGEVAG